MSPSIYPSSLDHERRLIISSPRARRAGPLLPGQRHRGSRRGTHQVSEPWPTEPGSVLDAYAADSLARSYSPEPWPHGRGLACVCDYVGNPGNISHARPHHHHHHHLHHLHQPSGLSGYCPGTQIGCAGSPGRDTPCATAGPRRHDAPCVGHHHHHADGGHA